MKPAKIRPSTAITATNKDLEPAQFRGQILAAAYVCIDRLGLDRTTIMDISSEAGISRPTIYKYVGNKDKIVEAISDLESVMNRAGFAGGYYFERPAQ